jgi:hypothetical protein
MRRDARAVPSTFRKTEVVAVQHVIGKSKKPLMPDGVEIRHPQQKIVIPGRPYRESLTGTDKQSEEPTLLCNQMKYQAPSIVQNDRYMDAVARAQPFRLFLRD